MLAAETLVGADGFRVEVSGCDENQVFFVERSDLDWGNFAGRHVSLQHMLPDGPMVFLRVLKPIDLRQTPPTAHVNVRLIAATNRDLRAEALSGRFREDLFYRLSSFQIRIPSLSERLEDIPLLVQFFLKKYDDAYSKNIAGLTRRAQTVLLQHPWPGNVRELENVISTACITATGDFIDLSDRSHQSLPLPEARCV